MRRKLLGLVGMLVIVLSVVYIARPAGHVPPYDANLVRLAESQLEGYCAGETFLKSQGAGSASAARTCREARAEEFSSAVDLAAVEAAFCQGVVDAGWSGDVPTCLDIMGAYQYWPTYDGSLTDQWNRARSYPRPPLQKPVPGGQDSRTGGRGDAPTRIEYPRGPSSPVESQVESETTETTTTEESG